jgi:pyruvate dehydrogenase (acetyl-transferring)
MIIMPNNAVYTKEFAVKLYETMCTIRKFEECVKHDFLAGEIPGFTHSYIGEEAIATGVCAALRDDDVIESPHRGHGHCVAKGADVNRMMAEIFGKETGLCKGRGGSMHIADFSIGMLGANGVVGGGYNLATGAALAFKNVLKTDQVAVVFFGDGASNRGTFHEAMNAASAWKLPVIFVNEMNCWASTTPYRTTCNVENISDRAAGYHIPGVVVDGQDPFAVYEAAKAAVERARAGEGPTMIECKTYRIEGHFVGDPELYRSKEETMKIFHDTDPLKKFREKMAESMNDLVTSAECDEIDAKVDAKIKAAKEFAMDSKQPDASEYMKFVYAD